jgi:type IV secretion system protein VirB1
MLEQCAPQIAPVTLAAVVQQESGGNPLALHDNTSGKSYRPASVADAAGIARDLIAAGHSVDIGLAQINSRNLPGLRLNVNQIFDPCTNIHAAQTILLRGWNQSGGDLIRALAAYNTGSVGSAVGRKYAAQVFGQAGVTVPAMVPGIPGGKVANWTVKAMSGLPPVRPVITWTPQASPLLPQAGSLALALR